MFVIGATDGVGARVIKLLAKQGSRVTGMHRSADQAIAIREAGGLPVRGDLIDDSAVDLAERTIGHDAIVFSAGAGGGDITLTTAIDERGAIKAVDAAIDAGVGRFVLVSAFMDAARGEKSPGAGFEHYMTAKRNADVHLAATDLNWLILRPGTLTNDIGRGLVAAGTALATTSLTPVNLTGSQSVDHCWETIAAPPAVSGMRASH